MHRFAITLLTLFALTTGLTVALTASPASACSCMEPNDERSFELASAVFTGEIVEVIEPPWLGERSHHSSATRGT